MEIGRVLAWTAERFGERIALVTDTERISWRELDRRCNQIAQLLLRHGVNKGDRVALFLSNSHRFVEVHLACQKLGALSTPYNIRLSATELGYCLTDSEPSVVVVDEAAAGIARAALEVAGTRPGTVFTIGTTGLDGTDLVAAAAECSDTAPGIPVLAEDPSVMLYTSGTTGKPKGVPRSQRNEYAATSAHVMQTRLAIGESTLGAMPMYHTMGLRSMLACVLLGGPLVCLPGFDPQRAAELIEQERVTSLYLVPTAYWSLLRAAREGALASVRKLAYAGAPMTSTLARQLADELQPEVFVNHYGSSEVYTFAINPDAGSKPGCAGRAGLNTRLRVVDPDSDAEHEPLPPGTQGEVVVDLAGDESFAGYWRRPDADAKALRHGWYHTGDLGQLDEDGDLWVSGRVDDMVISGGENVHPVEVEDVLATHPDVAEVAVVGLADERWGQAVTAFVVFNQPPDDPEAAAAELRRWAREDSGLSPYKVPKRVIVVAEVPKSPVGKILRRKLIESATEDQGARS
ncbi:hypothetical protein BI335_10460 [Enemella evansiae]|uniref:class I adenylate-forming enzyme family protein n=1 Tax=Enemella evansiae TaxID=2016499 RepID=UPI000B960369|nr:AMP-binding protein [Enemella evansiae]OYO16486.1 hypothetical protein BI335_10460 [Enemella evansiae]